MYFSKTQHKCINNLTLLKVNENKAILNVKEKLCRSRKSLDKI